MSLVVDNRAALGANPGLHALIVGVSSYPFLAGGAQAVADPWGMGQLTSTATTADKIVQWLTTAKLPVPLATCRVLLGPSPGEAVSHATEEPTVDNLIIEADAWRKDASANQDNITFFYFTGHGVQRTKEDAVLCLKNFRKTPGPALKEAVDLATIRAGMSPAPGRDDIARTQFYFVDACRVQPEEFKNFEPLETGGVFDKDLAGEDDRCSPIFYSSISNKAALAFPGGQTLFSEVLLKCLSGAAGDSPGEDANGNPQWTVSVGGLIRALPILIADLNRQHGADQTFTTGGQVKDVAVSVLGGPPLVDVRLEVDPQDASQVGQLTVTGDHNVIVVQLPAPVTPYPFQQQLPAGVYNVQVSFNPPHPMFVDSLRLKSAKAPRAQWKVQVVV